jgi:hypothetical protein
MLRIFIGWYVTDISGQHVSAITKVPDVRGTGLSQNVKRITRYSCAAYQKMKNLN